MMDTPEAAESKATNLYRPRSIKRKRRTDAQVEQLERQIIDVLKADHPQSIRHCFYRMTDPRLREPVEKSDRGYRHVQNRLTLMRRAGRVPYDWITDTTRSGYLTFTYNGSGEFLKRMAALYRADLWADAEDYCEVWTESRSIASVIRDDCHELAVNLYPAGGFSSISFAYEAAEYLQEAARGRPVTIFYIGDFDPAGVLIDRSIEAELRRHLPEHIDLRFERIGITAEQIEQYDLPRKPRKLGDRRALHVKDTVEAEAMPAGIMRKLLRDAVESLLPAGSLAVAKAAEESERAFLLRLGKNLGEAHR